MRKIEFEEVKKTFGEVTAITLNEHSNLPASSKLEKTVHGMGLSNIQRCARRYYGDIDIQFSAANEYGVYRLIVMLEGKD